MNLLKFFSRTKPSENTSGLKPVGHAVLLQPYEPEIKASRLVIPDAVLRRTAMAEMRATVIAVGSEAWRQEARLWGLWPRPRARVGDKVFVSLYCGAIVQGTLDGKQYRMVNDEDLFCTIEQENLQIARNEAPIRREAAAVVREIDRKQNTLEIANG